MSGQGFHPAGAQFSCPHCRGISALGMPIAYGTVVSCLACGNQFAITPPAPMAIAAPLPPPSPAPGTQQGLSPGDPQSLPPTGTPVSPPPVASSSSTSFSPLAKSPPPSDLPVSEVRFPRKFALPAIPSLHGGLDNPTNMLILGAVGVGATVVLSLLVVIVVSSRSAATVPPVAVANPLPVVQSPEKTAEVDPFAASAQPGVSLTGEKPETLPEKKIEPSPDVPPTTAKEPKASKRGRKKGADKTGDEKKEDAGKGKYSFGEDDGSSGTHGEILAYNLDGAPMSYQQTLTLSIGDTSAAVSGTNTLTPVAPKTREQGELQEATGTAFAVSPDGYLLTCEHCVDGAVQVEVKLDSKTYRCRVIASNKQLDAALLKIEAKGLPFLSLAESAKVELAESIRVIGFPFASEIGENLKVTAGEVSGFTEFGGQKLIQTDAAINSGNSGGPVVDERGCVVGIASSKIVAEGVSNIAFCVPSDFVRKWVTQHGFKPTVATDGPALKGPEIVRKVGPAVGLLKMKIDPVASLGARYGLESRVQASMKLPGRASTKVKASFYGECNSSGVVIPDEQDKSDIPLPPLVGDFGLFPIEPLSPDGAKKWTHERSIAIRVASKSANSQAPFGRSGKSGRGKSKPSPEADPEMKVFVGKEVAAYEIVGDDGTAVRIKKKCIARFVSLTSEDEYFESGGEGIWVFDKKKGMTRSIDYQGIIVEQETSGRTRMNVAIQIEDVSSPGALASSGSIGSGGGKAVPPSPVPSAMPEGSVEDESTPSQHLNQMGYLKAEEALRLMVSALRDSKEIAIRREVLELIAVSEIVESQRQQVVAAIDEAIRNNLDSETSVLAWKALARWDLGSRIGYATSALSDTEEGSRRAAIVYLGAQSDLKAAKALAKHLAHVKDRSQTEFALKAFGLPAENAVIAGPLKHGDREVRCAACRVLGAIGGAASRQALTDLVSKSDSASNEAKAALTKIE